MPSKTTYVHGYGTREQVRLQDQAATLVDLLHHDTCFPPGSRVLEAGCGNGAQTLTIARNSPGAGIVSVDISAESLAEAAARVEADGVFCYTFFKAVGTRPAVALKPAVSA